MSPTKVIAVLGVARSGTSWLGNIFDSSPFVVYRFQPLFSYEFRDRITYQSTKDEYVRWFHDLYACKSDFLIQRDKRDSGEYPLFNKADKPNVLVFKENRFLYYFDRMLRLFPAKAKAVCIIRNPCAVINSWLRNPKEFPPGSNVDKEWRFGSCKNEGREENFFGFYKWREAAHLFLDMCEKRPNSVAIVRYEDLVRDPLTEVRNIFAFVEEEVTQQTRSFILDSGSRHMESPYAVYKDKSVADRWREQLDEKIVDEIHSELIGSRLERFLA